MTTSKHWWVYTPTYDVVVPLLDDGTGPSEPTCDAVCVDAPTKRTALVAGVRQLRADGSPWLQDAENPFVGLTAELAECEHGVQLCCTNAPHCEVCEQAIRETELPS